MKPLLRALAVSLSVSTFALHGTGQEAGTPPAATGGVEEEVRSLRQVVEAQGKQIEALTEQFGHLRKRMEENTPAAAADNLPEISVTTPGQSTAPGTAILPAESKEKEIPRAEATGGGVKHIVAKGETLTSIAKHYNVALVELQKANKNLNERKLQIGQVLSIPAAPATAEQAPTTPEKKETH